MRKFIGGPLEGTNLEIMPSKAATQLPDGTAIQADVMTSQLTPAQISHNKGNIDIHAPQVFNVESADPKMRDRYIGPSVAQEWKILFRGERPYYRFEGTFEQ